MKKILLLTLALFSVLEIHSQCSGGLSFATTSAPLTSTPVTISSCNWAGDYNTITGVVSGNSYTLTASPSACMTIHSGSPTGPVVGFGMGIVSFTAPSSGTYYMTVNADCVGCGTGTTCITTTIANSGTGGGSAPCTSITSIIGCGAAYTTSTTGASSVISSLCATATPGLESVYSYTATMTGAYSLNISGVTGGGYAIGYATACGTSGWTCAGTALAPGTISSINLVSGTTYYFLFDATSTAASSITFGLVCPPGGPTTAGDCAVAANVCSNASFAIDPNGFGAIDEICPAGNCAANPLINPASINSGCLLSGELNSTWMIVNVFTGGNLEFSIGTPNSANWYCLDWAMWPYNASACAAIQAGTLAPVRCNYNGSCEEFTGLASALPAGATSMTNWEPPLPVGSATQYLICLSNYSSANTSVPLSFGGTAVVSCSPLAAESMELTGKEEAGYNQLAWTSTSELNVKHYLIQRSVDGITFETIQTIAAKGLSLEALTYAYEDLSPKFGKNYYRVILVHDNNSTKYSEIVMLEQKADQDIEIVRSYPNPANDVLNVVIASKTAADYLISLQTTSGKTVFTQMVPVVEGFNLTTLNIAGLNKGFYILSAVTGGKTIQCSKIAIE